MTPPPDPTPAEILEAMAASRLRGADAHDASGSESEAALRFRGEAKALMAGAAALRREAEPKQYDISDRPKKPAGEGAKLTRSDQPQQSISAPDPRDGVWRSIESAPKTGARLLLHPGPNNYSVVGRWSILNHWWECLPGKYSIKPTHWMALPAPPAGEGA